ncbi:MAG TPA: hypothetical protein PKI59_03380 [Candidatus Cloacimonadota bacterium]|nr:hypothetical protein [Candidatus Cloacimonadota bacterium]
MFRHFERFTRQDEVSTFYGCFRKRRYASAGWHFLSVCSFQEIPAFPPQQPVNRLLGTPVAGMTAE